MKNLTKKELETRGYVFITLAGGAQCATKLYKDENDVICNKSANARSLATLRKRLTEIEAK